VTEGAGPHIGAETHCNGAYAMAATVIESSADVPWAEFCASLEQPVFLMAVTGFGDLE
jgi:hypothetical protein